MDRSRLINRIVDLIVENRNDPRFGVQNINFPDSYLKSFLIGMFEEGNISYADLLSDYNNLMRLFKPKTGES